MLTEMKFAVQLARALICAFFSFCFACVPLVVLRIADESSFTKKVVGTENEEKETEKTSTRHKQQRKKKKENGSSIWDWLLATPPTQRNAFISSAKCKKRYLQYHYVSWKNIEYSHGIDFDGKINMRQSPQLTCKRNEKNEQKKKKKVSLKIDPHTQTSIRQMNTMWMWTRTCKFVHQPIFPSNKIHSSNTLGTALTVAHRSDGSGLIFILTF